MKTAKTQAPDSPDLDSTFLSAASSGNWRLPSGIPLGEFALQAGFLAPSLWNLSVRGAFARNHQPAPLACRFPRASAQQAVREC